MRRADHVVMLCGGVGYRAAVSAETLGTSRPAGEETTLHAHLIVRDDALALYGFHSEEERDLFLMLLSVQAVGPKVALAVLSGGTPRELLAAIAGQRRGSLPGGARESASAPPSGSSSSCARRSATRRRAGPIVARRRRGADPRELARDGLIELGYRARRGRGAAAGRGGRQRRGAARAGAAGRRGAAR